MKKLIISFILILAVAFPTQYTVRYVSGNVKIKNNNFQNGRKLHYQEKVKAGDTIITGPSSFAALRASDGSVVKVTANSVFEIKKLITTKSSRDHVFNIKTGKVLANISKLKKKSDIRFHTPVAVAGVRGTTLIIEVGEGGKTSLYVTEGLVAFGKDLSSMTSMVKANFRASLNSAGKISIHKMNAKDMDKAVAGVPITIAVVNKADVDDTDEALALTKEALRNELKNSIAAQKNRMSEIKRQVQQKNSWDIEAGRTVGPYRIRQVFRREGQNGVRVINFTKNTKTGLLSFVDINVLYEGKIPNVTQLLTDRDAVLSPSRIISSMGGVDAEGKNDLIQVTYDDELGTSTFINGRKVLDQPGDPINIPNDKTEGQFGIMTIGLVLEGDEPGQVNQITLKGTILDLNTLNGVNFSMLENPQSPTDFLSLITDIGIKGSATSPLFNTGTLEIIVTADLIQQLALMSLSEF